MGAEGAAIATSLVRWVMFVALLLVVLRMPDAQAHGISPAGLGFLGGLEAAPALGLSAGRRAGAGDDGVRGFGNVCRPPRHGAAGRVPDWLQPDRARLHGRHRHRGRKHGAGGQCRGPPQPDRYQARRLGGSPAHRLASWPASPGPSLVSARRSQVSTPTTRPFLPLAASLIGICGIILVFDGMQAVLMGALRGVADVWVPPGLQLIAWWCITVPVGYVLAFVVGIGVDGLMWGILGGGLERRHPAVGPLPRRGPAADRPLLRGWRARERAARRPKMATVGS